MHEGKLVGIGGQSILCKIGLLVSFSKSGRLSKSMYGRLGACGGGTPSIGINYWELVPTREELIEGF